MENGKYNFGLIWVDIYRLWDLNKNHWGASESAKYDNEARIAKKKADPVNVNVCMFHSLLDEIEFRSLADIQRDPMLSGSTVTTAWRVLGLRIEETASRYGR
jgi:hypothetical protein